MGQEFQQALGGHKMKRRASLVELHETKDQLVLQKAWRLWKDPVVIARQERQLQTLREEMLVFKAEKVKAALSIMMGSNADLKLHGVFMGWRDYLESMRHEQKVERLNQEVLEWKMQKNYASRQALSVFLGSRDDVLLRNVFAMWKECRLYMLQDRECQWLNEEIVRIRSRTIWSAHIAIQVLIDSRIYLLMQHIIATWKLDIDPLKFQLRQSRIDIMQSRMRTDGALRLAAMSLLDSQELLQLTCIFTGWIEVMHVTRQERTIRLMEEQASWCKSTTKEAILHSLGMVAKIRITSGVLCMLLVWHWIARETRVRDRYEAIQEALKQSILEMKIKTDNLTQRTMCLFLDTDNDVVLKSSLACWKELAQKAAQDRGMLRMKEELLRLQVKSSASCRHALTMLIGSQGRLLLQDVFVTWRELSISGRQARKVKHLGQELCQTYARSQDDMLLQYVFAYWKEHKASMLQERATENLVKVLNSTKRESILRSMSMLVDVHSDLLIRDSFSDWRDLLATAVRDSAEQEARRLKTQWQYDSLRRNMKFRDAEAALLLQMVLGSWSSAKKDSKKQKREAQLVQLRQSVLKLKAANEGSLSRVVSQLIQSRNECFVHAALSRWTEYIASINLDRSSAQRLGEVLLVKSQLASCRTLVLSKLLVSKQCFLLHQVLTWWTSLALALKNDNLEEKLIQRSVLLARRSSWLRAQFVFESTWLHTRLLFIAWRNTVVSGRLVHEIGTLRQDVMQRRKHLFSVMMESQGGLVLQNTFLSWREYVVEAGRKKELELLRQDAADRMAELKRQKEENLQRSMVMLFDSKGAMLMQNVFSGWKDFVRMLITDRLRSNAAEMRSSLDASKRAVMAKLFGSQDSLLMQNVFGGWQQGITAMKQERIVQGLLQELDQKQQMADRNKEKADQQRRQQVAELEEELLAARSKQEQAAKRALGAMFGAQTCVLMQNAVSGWKEILVASKQANEALMAQEKLENAFKAELSKMQSLREQSARKALQTLLGNQTDVLLRNAIGMWKAVLVDKQLRLQKEEAARRTMAVLLGSQSTAVVQSAMQAWLRLVRQRATEQMQEELATLRAQREEAARRTLALLFGADSSAVMRSALTGWMDVVRENSALAWAEETQKLREELAAEKVRKRESSQKTLLLLMGAESTASAQVILKTWHEFCANMRQQKEMDAIKTQMELMREHGMNSARRCLGMLFGPQGGLQRQQAFNGWRDEMINSRHARQLQQVQLTHAAQNRKARRNSFICAAKMNTSQEAIMLQTLFKVWINLVADSSRQAQYVTHMLRVKNTRDAAISACIAAKNASVKFEMFVAWKNMRIAAKYELELEIMSKQLHDKKHESARQAILILLGTQSESLLRSVLASWKDHACACRQMRYEESSKQELSNLKQIQWTQLSKMLMRFHTGNLLRDVLTVWQETLVHTAQEVKRELQEHKMKRLQVQSQSSARRVLGMMMGSQSSMVVANTFATWRRCWGLSKQEKTVEELKSEIQKVKVESLRKAMCILMDSQSGVLLQGVIACWKEMLEEKARYRTNLAMGAIGERYNEVLTQGKFCRAKLVDLYVHAQRDGLLLFAFAMWQQSFTEFRSKIAAVEYQKQMSQVTAFHAQEISKAKTLHEQQVCDLCEELKMVKTDSARHVVTTLLSSQGALLLQAAISAWHTTAVIKRIAKDTQKACKSSLYQVVQMLRISYHNFLRTKTFTSWLADLRSAKSQRLEELSEEQVIRAQEILQQRRWRVVEIARRSHVSLMICAVWRGWRRSCSKSTGVLVTQRMVTLQQRVNLHVLRQGCFIAWFHKCTESCKEDLLHAMLEEELEINSRKYEDKLSEVNQLRNEVDNRKLEAQRLRFELDQCAKELSQEKRNLDPCSAAGKQHFEDRLKEAESEIESRIEAKTAALKSQVSASKVLAANCQRAEGAALEQLHRLLNEQRIPDRKQDQLAWYGKKLAEERSVNLDLLDQLGQTRKQFERSLREVKSGCLSWDEVLNKSRSLA
eukprot:gnl/MRDRNA2_/MRDRNA2_77643_c0_seq2.p1 gnl/MRDRNA2_/MRDRNA2_77643_c0~~gnl/MRDRNA2_/MRDRNA2_77643_c0_seq2.p1  ORF type:complete len:1997 (-),score=444.86 gnl/MRDRNA2_/MRDRNA2_77643_c0_seq2:169-6159(-)